MPPNTLQKTPQNQQPVRVTNHLSEKEDEAMRLHKKANNAPLAPSQQAELYELYLNGQSLDQIFRANKTLKFGAICQAAVEHDWYGRRKNYIDHLMATISERARQAQAEGVDFASNALAMMHKRYTTRINKYLQTGNEDELGDMKNWGLPQYKQIAELLLKMTGQDNKKTIKEEVNHTGTIKHEMATPEAQAVLDSPMSSDFAMQVLHSLQNVPVPVDAEFEE
ncbi:hypothetical protein UFOVP75_98 [uncultured Caudovirales phage]|uniref:Terminase small subunit n=1 Tax=uncultured Caudovirales phage TaxID=2100421 RepID=A0A6J5KYW3_9CAUD|nr:hypothetical protein UFOVP75_98 [uncultured Caudovirales phage]